jgi:putative addiction module CopG family antidote
MNVEIPPELEEFVQRVIRQGTYDDVRAVVSEALHLLQQREELITDVNAGVVQLDRGEGMPLDPDNIKARGIQRRVARS